MGACPHVNIETPLTLATESFTFQIRPETCLLRARVLRVRVLLGLLLPNSFLSC